MSTFAAVFAPDGKAWRGTEAELGDVEAVDDVADVMIDFAAEQGSDLCLLFVEADDEWFAIVRTEESGEPRIYLSDVRVADDHPLARVLSEASGLSVPEQPESAGARPEPAPEGDADLLTDLGMTGDELRSLSTGGGVLPGDALAAVAERAGFGDLLDGMRL